MIATTLTCRGVSVNYGAVRAVDEIDLEVAQGQTLALLGPSGSGKTTLLYAIAGFVPLASGEILIGGEVVSTPGNNLPPERRAVGMVFQNYALWPHLDAAATVAYPLRRAGQEKREARQQAARLLDKVGIGDLGSRRPAELSGGQQQRVGLARALARAAAIYLFDEPTAHLDATVRQSVAEEMARRRREAGAAAIYSTHDAAEAMSVADRVAILRRGRLIQVGSPTEIYERPADLWAARLTGPASQLRGMHTGDGLSIDGRPVPATGEGPPGEVEVLVRPDWVSPGGDLIGTVTEVWYRGTHTDYRVETPAGILETRLTGPPRLAPGDRSRWTVERAFLPGSPPAD